MIESFENGSGQLEGPERNGTVASEATYATDGAKGMQVTSAGNDDWFGTHPQNALNLSGKTSVDIDVQDLFQRGSEHLDSNRFQLELVPEFRAEQSTAACSEFILSYDVASMSCTPAEDLTQIHAIWFYFNAGSFDVDNVRTR